jgi:orotidine-5'-phosphate decarboxylase
VGLVVGATAPAELERIRGIAPELALLVPGVGAQGGEVEPVLRFGPAVAAPAGGRPGGGLLVNVSRGISGAAGTAGGRGAGGGASVGGAVGRAARDGEVAELLAAAAREWSARLRV